MRNSACKVRRCRAMLNNVIRRLCPIALCTALAALSACGGGGSGPPPAAPTVTIGASVTSLVDGQSAALNWSSTGATSCSASGSWSGGEQTFGSASVTPSATGTASYALTCNGAGGTGSAAVNITVTPRVPIATAASSTVDPLAPITFTVSNDDPNASYSAQVSLGSNVVYTVALGPSNKGALTLAAPPGAIASLSSPSFTSGTINVQIGWADAGNSVQYGSAVAISVNALPTIPSSLAPGTAFLTYLAATKRLTVQTTANLMAIGTLASVPVGYGVQGSAQTAQSVDAMITLIQQVQASGSAQIGTYQAQSVTLTSRSLSLLDQFAAAQLNALEGLSQSQPGQVHAQKRAATSLSSGQPTSLCALDDPTCWTNAIATGSRNWATAISNSLSTICYATAGVALVVGAAPEIVAVAAIAGVASTFATTSIGTAISATIQGGTAALLNGTASVSDLAPSVAYFGQNLVQSALTALGELPLENLPSGVQAAYNLAQAASNEQQALTNAQSAFSTALQDGQLPTSPTQAPPYTASMTIDPATNTGTVTLSPPPSGATTITVAQSDSSGTSYTFQNFIAVNGTTGGFPVSAPPNGSIGVNTVSSGGGYALATTDYDTSYTGTSDTTSFPTTQATVSATFSGSWSWGGPASNGCPANDSGQFVAQITATDTTFSGTITSIGGISNYQDGTCEVTNTDSSDSGSISGTVSGTSIQITDMSVAGSVSTLVFTGTGTLTGTSFTASITRSTGGTGQISAYAQ
jgi:hypothetical protein